MNKTIIKTISYRIISTASSIVIVMAITGRVDLSMYFGAIELIVKPIIYFMHEITWENLLQKKTTTNEPRN